MTRPVALVIAPYKTATSEEKAQTFRAVAHLAAHGWCPVFLPWALDKILDDQREEQRAIALECSSGFVTSLAKDLRNAAFQVGARITAGMEQDIADWQSQRAISLTIPILKDMNRLGLTPPATRVRHLTWTAKDGPYG